MKKLWTIVSVLAVANLLAVGAVVGWLAMSDRLDLERLRDLRQVLAKTRTQERAEEAQAAAEAEAQVKLAAEQEKVGQPPLRAGDKVDIRVQQAQADVIRVEAMQRDVQILRDTLVRERQALSEERTALESRQKAWDAMRQEIERTEANEQFKKTLATLEGLKPDKVKTALQELINAGNRDQVVSYLNAMGERSRTKVVDEFIQADPKLASDLLERLRTRGQLAQGAAGAP